MYFREPRPRLGVLINSRSVCAAISANDLNPSLRQQFSALLCILLLNCAVLFMLVPRERFERPFHRFKVWALAIRGTGIEWSAWGDSNTRPTDSKSATLTKLSYTQLNGDPTKTRTPIPGSVDRRSIQLSYGTNGMTEEIRTPVLGLRSRGPRPLDDRHNRFRAGWLDAVVGLAAPVFHLAAYSPHQTAAAPTPILAPAIWRRSKGTLPFPSIRARPDLVTAPSATTHIGEAWRVAE